MYLGSGLSSHDVTLNTARKHIAHGNIDSAKEILSAVLETDGVDTNAIGGGRLSLMASFFMLII